MFGNRSGEAPPACALVVVDIGREFEQLFAVRVEIAKPLRGADHTSSSTRGPIPEVLSPQQCDCHWIGVRGEVARLYRLGLNGRIRSDEMTRFIYALKEIRACLEAELLTDVQQRLALLSRDMDTHNGQRVLHQPANSRS